MFCVIIIIVRKDIFKYELNEEFLRKLRYSLMILIKCSLGITHNVSDWHKRMISSCIGIVSSDILVPLMDKINQILFYPYLTDDLIEFTILKIIQDMEKNIVNGTTEKRRRAYEQ